MTMTMHELTAARSLTTDSHLLTEEEPAMTTLNDPTDAVQTDLAPRRAPLRLELAPPTNQVQITGYVYPQVRGRGKERKARGTTQVRSRDLNQDVLERMDLLVMEEDGDTYVLELPLSSVLVKRDATLFAPDSRLVVEGYLVNTARTDRQLYTLEDQAFGHIEGPQGQERTLVQYHDLSIEVLAIRAATDEDVDGSWVCLRGKTMAAPSFRRTDDDQRFMQARTQLMTQLRKPSARAGSRAVVQIDTRLPIMVSTRLPQAPALYHPGNEVVVEGRLQPFRFQLDRADAALSRALERHDEAWAAEQASQALAAPEDQDGQRKAHRRYLYQRINLQARTKVGIAVTFVELVRGQRVNFETARQTWTAIMDRRLGRVRPTRLPQPTAPVTATLPQAPATVAAAEPTAAMAEPAEPVIETVDLPALRVPAELPTTPKRKRKVVAVVERPEGDAPLAAVATEEPADEVVSILVEQEEPAAPAPEAEAALPIGDEMVKATTEPVADDATPMGDATDLSDVQA